MRMRHKNNLRFVSTSFKLCSMKNILTILSLYDHQLILRDFIFFYSINTTPQIYLIINYKYVL